MFEGRFVQEKHEENEERLHVAFSAEIVEFLGPTPGATGESGSNAEPWLLNAPTTWDAAQQLVDQFQTQQQAASVESRGIHRMRAVVRPKRKVITGEGVEYELDDIFEVPVGFYKFHKFMFRPPMSEGDVVMVVCHDLALDEMVKDRERHPVDRNRLHAMEDAMILGLPHRMDSDPYTPDEALDGLYMAALDEQNSPLGKWIMGPDGKLHIHTPEVIWHVPPGTACGQSNHKDCVPQPPGAFYVHTDYEEGLTEPTFYETPNQSSLFDFMDNVVERARQAIDPQDIAEGLDAVRNQLADFNAPTTVREALKQLQKIGEGESS